MKVFFLTLLMSTLISMSLFSQSLEFSHSASTEHTHSNGIDAQSNLAIVVDLLEKENYTDKMLEKYLTANNIDLKHKEKFLEFLDTKYESDFAMVDYFEKNANTITLEYLKQLTDSLVKINVAAFSASGLTATNSPIQPKTQQTSKAPIPSILAATPCNNLDFAAGTAGWNPSYGGRRFCKRKKVIFVWVCWWWLWNYKNNAGKPGWGESGISPNNTPANVNSGRAGSQFCINTPGFFDPAVAGLSTTPPNGANSLRLGSNQTDDYSAQRAENTFLVTSANSKLIYHYAVVIQDPGGGHGPAAQPYFKIRVRDDGGNEIPCFSFDVTGTSANWIGGFQLVGATGSQIPIDPAAGPQPPPDPAGAPGALFKNWTSVMVPLDSYIGRVVTLSFETNDCTMGGHFAYAYVSAECTNTKLKLTQPNVCRGNPGKIIAPVGGYAYSWSGPVGIAAGLTGIVSGQNNDTVVVNRPGKYICTISLFSNNPAVCQYKIDTIVEIDPRAPHPNFMSNATVCSTDPVNFINTSLLIAERPNSDWDFENDGIVDFTGDNPPPYIFPNPGTYSVNLTVRGGFCIHDTTMEVIVNAKPVALFRANSVCQNGTTNFTNLSAIATGSISLWEWDFANDGSIEDNAKNPNYIYPNSGTFIASLNATSNLGCVATFTSSVEVWGRAFADFTGDKTCYGEDVTLTNNTNILSPNLGGISGYIWQLGDGTPNQNSVNVTHAYTLNGNVNAVYNVTLVANTAHGCSDNITKVINVYAKPDAAFTSNYVCFGTPSHLISTSSGNGNAISNYKWDYLSNGTIDQTGLSNVNTILPGYGDNPVTLEVITAPVAGLTCSTKTMVNVWVNPNPIASFDFINRCINAQPALFDATNSSIAIGTNTNYAWLYGDGTNDASAIPAASHTYAAVGRYNVSLTITSDSGCVKSIMKQIDIFQKPFTAVINSKACAKQEMNFNANPIGNSGNITNWFWDFDNDITTLESTGQDVAYVFTAGGTNTVALITETDKGCMDTLYHVVFADFLPKPRFLATNTAGCALPLCVTFTDNTLPVTLPAINQTWKWVFGDGSITTEYTNKNQTHCFSKSSASQITFFDVKLIVTTDQGCTDSLVKGSLVKVYPKPIAAFSANTTDATVITPLVAFTNESVGYTKWWWNLGDSDPVVLDSITENPNYVYNNFSADFYNTNLIVENEVGCKDTAFKKVTIAPDFVFYAPNAFSPRTKDGVNDVFTGKGVGIIEYDMRIYDRWGEEIFKTNNINVGWDGTAKSGTIAKTDVYTWKVRLTDVFKREHDYIGHVTLLK